MPTYEYACLSCGHHVEVYQRFSDDPLTVCAVCGGPLRKVFHPAGILFKGSGFYATDSRSARSRGTDGSADKAAATSRGDRKESSAAKSEGSGDAGSKPTAPSTSSSTKEKSA
jgi:putative FmdB family regulatory protein